MKHVLGRIGSYLLKCVTIDSRSLALFRIAAGLLIIGDILARASTFSFFYTEDGVVPRELAQARTVENAFSFFFYTQNSTVIALLFVIHFLVAIQLIIGYRSTFAMVLSFLFVISLDHHNPLVLSHADTLFRLIMFWGIFIPVGERWSIDALQRDRPPRRQIASLGTAAILLQMIYMYVVNGIHKVHGELWNSREATPLIFGLDDMTYFLATPLREFPLLLEILGTMWYMLLIISPVLLLLPGRMRTALTMMYFMAHFSFTVTVRIGGFGWVAMGALLLFLPATFWEDLKSIANQLNLRERIVVPVHRAALTFGNRAATAFPAFQLQVPIPATVRAAIYDVGMTFLIMAVFVFPTMHFLSDEEVIAWERSGIEERIDSHLRRVGVQQSRWTVFAPNPRTTDRYFVFPALTTDDEILDVFNDRPLTFDRPYDQLRYIYPNYRERFYMNAILRAGETGAPPRYLARRICRDYAERGIELRKINMWVVNEQVTRETIADYHNREQWRELLSVHACEGYEPREIDLSKSEA